MSDETLPSFNQQLRQLRRGDSHAKARRFPLGSPEAAEINETLSSMRRTVNSTVSRLRESTGSNFRVESGSMITSDNEAILAIVSVTRL